MLGSRYLLVRYERAGLIIWWICARNFMHVLSAPGIWRLYPQRARKVDGAVWNEPNTNGVWRQPVVLHLDAFVSPLERRVVLVVHDHVWHAKIHVWLLDARPLLGYRRGMFCGVTIAFNLEMSLIWLISDKGRAVRFVVSNLLSLK